MKMKIIRAAVIVLLLLIPIYNFAATAAENYSASSPTDETVTDVAAVDALMQQSVADVEEKIDKIDEEKRYNERIKAQREARLKNEQKLREQISSGEVTYRQIFKNTLIVGDSLMCGLKTYGILDSANMIAKVSANLTHLADNLSTVISNNPRILILHYGINMIELDDNHLGTFIGKYESLIRQLQSALPNTRIVVSGLFRPANHAIKSTTRFGRTPQYNAALKQLCDKLGIEFLDNSSLLKGTENYYTTDGVHLYKQFYYDKWLPHVVMELGL